MATFNLYKNLSEVTWLPVQFQTVGGEETTQDSVIQFENGIRLPLNESLKNYKDYTMNKGCGLFLTKLGNTPDFLQNKTDSVNSTDLQEILTPIAKISYPVDLILEVKNNLLTVSDRKADNSLGIPSNFSDKDNFKFVFTRDTTHFFSDAEEYFVSLETPNISKLSEDHLDNHVLTWSLDSASNFYNLSFQPRKYPESYSQKFSYLLGDNGICLFIPNTKYYFIVARDPNSNVYRAYPYNPASGNDTLPVQDTFFRFLSYQKSQENTSLIKNSHLTKYNVNKLDYQQTVTPDFETIQKPYLQNFLGVFPLENWSLNSEKNTAVYDLNFVGLKNYQTSQYNYSHNPTLVDGYDGVHRDYDRIFTGTNQQGGLGNVYFGYKANTIEIIFPTDQETSFNFSPLANNLPLSASGLIEDGAIAGHHPYVSDRIMVWQADYDNILPSLKQPTGVPKETNAWFCSWLSGSENRESIWMDRWYNAAFYTLDQALSAQTLVYNDRLDPSKPYIYDVPSQQILSPGAFYKYFHVGEENSKNYIKIVDAYKDSPYGSRILEISSWNQDSLRDQSGYDNHGILYAVSGSNVNESFWDMDGSVHAVFPAKSVLLENRQFTTSLWVYSEDWSNIKGRQIFGNYYDSGYGLINEDALTAPMITFAESSVGQIFNLNYKFKVTNVNPITSVSETKNLITIRRPDFSYWLFDTTSGIGKRFDAEGRLLNTSDRVLKVSQIEMDEDFYLYLYQPSRQKVIILTPEGNITNEILISNKKTKRIEIFKYKTLNFQRTSNIQILEIFGNASVIDNNGNIWQVLGSNLYKTPYDAEKDVHTKSAIFATVGPTEQITCDSYNQLWILHGDDYISKMSQTGKFWTSRFGKRLGLPDDPCATAPQRHRFINFVKTPERGSIGCESYEFKDLAVILDNRDNQLFLLDINGDIMSKMDLTLLNGLVSETPKFFADGDFTGYQHIRKFGVSKNNLSWKIKTSNPGGDLPENISLNYDASTLYPGWHHLVLTFDSTNGVAKYYVDSQLVDSAYLSSNENLSKNREVFFNYRSSFLLGADSIKNSVLNDIIGIQDAYKFVGKIAHLKLYNKTLSPGDISQLYFSFHLSDKRKPLIWNMPTGNRNYIEEARHWFKMQLPGNKSQYFNINIHNLHILDEDVRLLIEDAIRKNIKRINPANTSLYKINWI